jgi:2,4-dienoyl-CoA reductase (NADPH2)
VAEQILARGEADLISMARPLLADPDFVNKAAAGQSERINTCIACNQACLDHAFANRKVSCLVNPRAGHETFAELPACRAAGGETRGSCRLPVRRGWRRRPCWRSAATKSRCLRLTDEIGGQFNLAKRVPGKEEYAETVRYYAEMLTLHGVDAEARTSRHRTGSDVGLRRGCARQRRDAAHSGDRWNRPTRRWLATRRF